MKYLKFYKLHDWILAEMGASADAALIAVLNSFSEMGKECRLSFTQIAEIMKISRRQAIRRIKQLEADGYITVTAENRETNVYTVNVENFMQPSDINDTSSNSASDINDTSLVTKMTLPSDINDTSASDINDTQKEKKTEIKKEKGREDARARANPPALPSGDSVSFVSLPDHPNIKLTESEYAVLKYGLDYSTATKAGKSLEGYLCTFDEYNTGGKRKPFAAILRWALEDGCRRLSESEMKQNKQRIEEAESFTNFFMHKAEEPQSHTEITAKGFQVNYSGQSGNCTNIVYDASGEFVASFDSEYKEFYPSADCIQEMKSAGLNEKSYEDFAEFIGLAIYRKPYRKEIGNGWCNVIDTKTGERTASYSIKLGQEFNTEGESIGCMSYSEFCAKYNIEFSENDFNNYSTRERKLQ